MGPDPKPEEGTRAVAVLALAYFAVLWLPSFNPHYGFYSDELYYLACAKRLAWGYVDHPPLFVFALRLYMELFGDSLVALRALPAGAGAATVILTGWMARRLGGGAYAQALAALAWMVGQGLALFDIFTVNCLGLLLWTGGSAVFLELCRTRDRRLWVLLGVVFGLGFLTKHTIVLWMASLGGATLATDLRRDLRTPWPWAGTAVFSLLALPNLLWQIANGWPSVPFYLGRAADVPSLSPLEVVYQQIFVHNPATLPVWIAGVLYFLRSGEGRPYRALGIAFVVAFALAVIGGQGIPYRITGSYPVVFAGGAVLLASLRRPDAGRLRRALDTLALPALMLLFGAIAVTLALPVLPPRAMVDHPLHDGSDGWRVEVGERKRPPYHLANRTHWRDLVARVAEVHAGLDPAERENAIVLADYFGHAGAVERYGPEHGLPDVYGPHTGYFLWGPPDGTPSTVIAIGIDEALLREHYADVRIAAVFRCDLCPGWQDDLPIRVASRPTAPFAGLWKALGARGGMDRYRRLLRAQEERKRP